MAFSQSVVDEAWKRSGGYCECRRTNHGHSYTRCHKQLVYENRGKTGQRGCWEAHHITAGGPDVASNCEILCCECHAGTGSYGRP